MVQTTPFWRVAWSLFLCPLHRPFSSLLEGKVVFAVEQPPVDGDRLATVLPVWGLDKDDEREKVQRKREERYDVPPPLRKKIAWCCWHGDQWLLTWKTKGQFWNSLPKQYIVHKKNNSFWSPYFNFFGFDFHITFKWATANTTFPIKKWCFRTCKFHNYTVNKYDKERKNRIT